MTTRSAVLPDAAVAPKFSGVLVAFDPITLSDMDGVALLKRTDTKYLLSASDALDTLECLARDYWALEVAESVAAHWPALTEGHVQGGGI